MKQVNVKLTAEALAVVCAYQRLTAAIRHEAALLKDAYAQTAPAEGLHVVANGMDAAVERFIRENQSLIQVAPVIPSLIVGGM